VYFLKEGPEIRVGEMLREMKVRKERATKGGDRGNQHSDAKSTVATLPKLSDLGITKDQSSRWQDAPGPAGKVRAKIFRQRSSYVQPPIPP
jgi:hypothetical protein